MSYYHNKNVVITGGSSGLGRAYAINIAKRGGANKFVIADLDEVRGEETLTQLTALGAQAKFIRCDVSQCEQVEQLARESQEYLGRIDLVFNNAGVASGGQFLDIPAEDWDWLIGINLLGVVHGCRAFGRIMQQQRSGHLVNTASLAAFGALPGMSLYNTAKAGVVMFSETIRAEFAGYGVRVSAVCPSFLRTNLMERTRTTAPEIEKVTRLALTKNQYSADYIANKCLDQIAKNKLYVLPTLDAKIMWRVKRFFPRTVVGIGARTYPFAMKQLKARFAK